jgi:hypothetical protein
MSTVLFQEVSPLVIINLQCIGQGSVLALVERIHIGALFDKHLDQASILQMQCAVQNGVAVGIYLSVLSE